MTGINYGKMDMVRLQAGQDTGGDSHSADNQRNV